MSAPGGEGSGGPRPSAQSTVVDGPDGRRALESEETGAATPGARRRDLEEPDGPVPVGSVLDARYRLLELIGQGGMGAVYRARDLSLDAEIAVKVLDREVASDPKRVEYFRNEVRTARKVTHPNVCRLHDLVEADGLWLITMQHVEGSSLADRLRAGGALPVPEVLRILRDIATGLAAAHTAGVVHRDLKPANILLAAKDDHAIVADFGIAAEVNRLGVATMDVAGTRGYMSPEQAAGRSVDARTDVYAFGVLAYRMLTGEVPATAPTRVGATDVGGPAPSTPPDAPPGLMTLIDQCLSSDPGMRPKDGRVLVAHLEALGERRDPTPKLVATEAVPTATRRRWPGRAVAIGAVLILAGVATTYVWTLSRGEPGTPIGLSASEIVFEPLTASLSPDDSALPDSVVRLTIEELEDAWAVPARATADGGPPPTLETAQVRGRLFLERDRRLVAEIELTGTRGTAGRRFEAAGPRPLAMAIASWLVESSIAEPRRRPTSDDLARVCASSVDAWRLWRRAQRESRMQRWGVVRDLIAKAVELDPKFTMAHVEVAFSYMRGDEAMARAYQKATDSMCPTLGAEWKKTLKAAETVWAGDMDGATKMVDEILADPALPVREKQYLATRWAFGMFFGGLKTDGVSRLEWITDQYPSDPAAAKLLANYFLGYGEPSATAAARRFGEMALATAPYDLAVRADLARALILDGDVDGARRHARIIDRADPAEKQMALAGNEAENSIAMLHLELGELAEAERDARRLLLGSATEKVQGGLALGTLDLLKGAFASGVDRLAAAADLAAKNGVGTVETMMRWKAAFAAYHAGELERARDQLAKIPATDLVREREVMSALIDYKAAPPMERAHHLAHARVTADSLPGMARLQLLQVVAHARGDGAAVLSLQDQIRAVSRARMLTSRYLTADAHAWRGELREAADDFERLVNDPHAWKEPVLTSRAWRRLGDVRVSLGDREGAAAAYKTLLSRWTAAPASDPDLAAARGALEKLNGSVNGPDRPPW